MSKQTLRLTIAAIAGTIAMTPAVAANYFKLESEGNKAQSILNNAPYIKPAALKAAMNAYEQGIKNGEIKNSKYLTLVDFSKPSSEKRLTVINMETNKPEMHVLTAHGAKSGKTIATRFSNAVNSHQSSLGLYRTSNEYIGKYGKSMRVDGLDKGVNDKARSRAIVIHPAKYVTPSYASKYGRVGNSWGCFAINPKKVPELLNLIGNGSAMYAYA